MGGASSREIAGFIADLREGERPVPCFHWALEFPEVFDRGGFDAMVGNPPYVGGTLIGGRLGLGFHDYLVEMFQPATGLADLIAFFVRRVFDSTRMGGAFGFVTTNTVAQGDTRTTGLAAVLNRGGTIYHATRRYRWPGQAAVVASVFNVRKGTFSNVVLDDAPVQRISSYLLAGRTDATPVALVANASRCFLGAKIWGAGFLFEPSPSNGSSSLEDMARLLAEDPRNQQVIFPYIGGEEFNEVPTQHPVRYVIDFARMPLHEARRWPLLFARVEERVKPVRATNKQRNYREEWWLHANRAEEVAPFLAENGRALALSSVSKHLSLAFVARGTVAANSLLLICLHRDGDFAVLQSRVHELWARFFGSSMKDDLRYTTPCFDTFPRPAPSAGLEVAGGMYYRYRAEVMRARDEGSTRTYNRFHDPDEHDADIVQLRDLHAAMDRAVLDAYGWTDLQPTCEFLLDYEEEEDADATPARRKKKPWRYRWPDAFRDEVLARLLELNAQRAKEEAQRAKEEAQRAKEEALAAAAVSGKKPRAGAKSTKAPPAVQARLFGEEDD